MKRPATLLLSTFALVTTVFAVTAASGTPVSEPQQGAQTATRPVMQVYKSPTCGCCKEWITHVKEAGFDVQVTDQDERTLQATKASRGVGARLQSCHTAVVNGYVVEGHVPAEDIWRMLKEKPAVAGIAAPGMPRGSPGMEMPNGAKDAYDVLAFTKDGTTRVFARH